MSESSQEPRPRGRTRAKRPASGFTLLEVLIALAILAISLSSLMSSQFMAMSATRYARDVTAIALLAEDLIIEMEFEHRDEGWTSSDIEKKGDFSDYGYDDVEWACTIHFIELPEYSELMQAKEGVDEVSGEADDNVMDTGDQAFAGLGMVWGIVKTAIESSIRKVDCTVVWDQGGVEQDFLIQTFWTDPMALQQLPGAGGEFTDENDDSGANEEGGGSGSAPGGGGRGPSGGALPPSRGGGSGGGMTFPAGGG